MLERHVIPGLTAEEKYPLDYRYTTPPELQEIKRWIAETREREEAPDA